MKPEERKSRLKTLTLLMLGVKEAEMNNLIMVITLV